MDNRGKIRNRKVAKQLRDFSGLRWGTITPTDIDGFFEIGDRIFVFIEVKYKDAPMPNGQRIAFERLIDIVDEKKSAILVIGTHEEESENDIDVANCLVKKYRTKTEWKEPKGKITIRQILDKFINHAQGR